MAAVVEPIPAEETRQSPFQDTPNGKEEKPDVRPSAEQHQNGDRAPANDPLNVMATLVKQDEQQIAGPTVEPVTSIVPGTTLRRLEDPTPFLFSRPGSLDTASQQAAKPAAAAGPRYRVLEAPEPEKVPVIPASTSMTFSASPYKVLEAPSSPPGGTSSSPNASPSSSSNRSMASDVLEKARTRFDRFWTKKDTDK